MPNYWNDYKPYKKLNDSLHLPTGGPRQAMFGLMQQQGKSYDPNSDTAYRLMRQRNPGRRLKQWSEMPPIKYDDSKSQSSPGSGPGVRQKWGPGAYVPEKLSGTEVPFGRPMIANHEFAHTVQPVGQTFGKEIGPSVGDIAFGAESFRRQEGRPLLGKIPIGHKNQSAEWMRQQAKQHGYFDGRSMQGLLSTPAGKSWSSQAAHGIVDSAPRPAAGVPVPFMTRKQRAESYP